MIISLSPLLWHRVRRANVSGTRRFDTKWLLSTWPEVERDSEAIRYRKGPPWEHNKVLGSTTSVGGHGVLPRVLYH